MEGDSLSCVKYLMFIFNFFIFLCGSFLLGLGLWFFMFILVIFLAELSAAILAFLFRENLTRDFFTKDLKRHYRGNNSTDVFTTTWNSVMITFECCGVNGPEDFSGALHFKTYTMYSIPEACCGKNVLQHDGEFIGRAECMMGKEVNRQGCYSTILNSLEPYVYIAGALAIGVLAVELFAMIFAMCLFRGIQ
ncbi:hypothetical protein GDO78_018665 [Eleutherodactylus coqui]|uniref:Tetraspanin n=1 Tax=Eleutherodactylus coqui TaxID=57060 RepID=A0A8J6EJM2_ELECQ|nr:hypothetical protein GDO78_018665 [Eleutherodactylus coqui]